MLRAPTLLGTALAFAAVLLLAACSTTSLPTQTPVPSATAKVTRSGDGVLTIGTLFPVSGQLSFLAPAQTAGVDAAVADINAGGGVEGKPVVVVHQDSGDANTPAPAAALTALLAAKADVVIGPSSSAVAAALLPAAAKAHVPLITPAATFPIATTPASAPYLFRTIPTYAMQAYALARAIPEAQRARVVLIAPKDDVGLSLAQVMPAALADNQGTLVASVTIPTTAPSYPEIVAKALAAKPDAVVLATEGGATPQTLALISALTAAKLGGPALWLTSQNLADYSQALPAGTLTGVGGVLEGAAADPAFTAKLAAVHPGLTDTLYAAEAYDATILAALAATSAGDDGGASIASRLRAVSVGGATCATWASCTKLLKAGKNIDYRGVSGPVDLGDSGELLSAYYGVYRYAAGNTATRVGTVLAY